MVSERDRSIRPELETGRRDRSGNDEGDFGRRSVLKLIGVSAIPAAAGTAAASSSGYGSGEYGAGPYGGDDVEDGDDDTDDGDDSTGTAPSIDAIELEERNNPQWARVEVRWTVSADDGLDSVTSELLLDGDEIDAVTSSASGTETSDEHQLRERRGHGETYEVVVTVTDQEGVETTETRPITL